MSRGTDLAGFIRGLESITKALVETQRPEWRRVWQNSRGKAEEVISNKVSQQPNPQAHHIRGLLYSDEVGGWLCCVVMLKKFMQEKLETVSNQASVVMETMKNQAPSMVSKLMNKENGGAITSPFDTSADHFDISSPVIDPTTGRFFCISEFKNQ
ncbi:hypothetical protein KUTeg_013065 [Tegillarca granosa]|uniref:Uncharacterized protein n=1 Tax=Tegillarca granosa TaxID=220873 RepID=A0ABQ9EV15_TEGGR|nr:hypothetical protein KUTeg_013065 [Tegillarca granosa]